MSLCDNLENHVRSPGEKVELLIGNSVTNDNEGAGPHVAIDNGERRLVAVVLMQECGCGCHTEL